MAQKVYLKKSSVVDKTPSANGLDFGELAINYASGTGKSFLATKKYNGTIAKFHEDAYNEATFASKGDLSLVQSDIAEIKPNYVTKAQLSAASGAAVSSAYTMAVNYVNQAVSGLSIGDYLTVASASSVFADINSQLSEMANSAVVESKISALTKTVEDNEYVVAQAFNDLNDRVDSIDERIGDFSGEFLTVSSASSVFADMGSGIQEAKDKAQSAYTYATIISGSVYSKTQTDSAIATAKNAGVTSAYNAAVATASAYTDSRLSTVNASVSELGGKITAVSATVTNTYWTSATTQSKIATAKAEAHASAAGSAKTYTDNALAVVSAAANTRIAGVEEEIDATKSSVTALSAGVKTMLSTVYTYKGTVANFASLPSTGQVTGYVYNVEAANGNIPAGTNYAWNGNAWDALGGSVDLSAYAKTTDVDEVEESLNGFKTWFNTASGTLATKALLNTTSGNAVTAANAYTDAHISGFTSGNFLTVASATARFSTVDENITKNTNRINGVSGTVKTAYWDSATTLSKIGVASGYAYNQAVAAASSYTKSVSGSIAGAITTINSNISDINTRLGSFSGDYVTKALLNTTSGKAVAAANAYTDAHISGFTSGNFLTVASATSRFNSVDENITGVSNKIDGVSGTVKATYWTSATTQSKITEAKNAGVTSAYNAATAVTKTLSGNVESRLSTINQSVTDVSNKIDGVSATVKNTYWTSATTQSKITEAKNAGVTSAYNASTAVTKTLSGNVESRLSTINQSISDVSNKIDGVSATVKNTYWTSATTQTKINDAKNAGVTSAFTAASAVVKTLSGNVESRIATFSQSITNLSANTVSAINGVYKVITDNEEVTAAALNELNDDLDNLSSVFETLNGSVTSISNTVNSVTGTVGTLSEDVSTLKSSASTLNDKITLINGRYISAVTYTTAATTTSIANNTLTIPKPKTLVIQENDAALSTAISYDGTTALTAKTYDKKVEQTNNTAANFRPILLGSNNHATAGSIPTTTATAGSVFNIGIYAQPSTKKIFAAGFQLTGGGTSLLIANGGSVAQSTFAAATRKVNGHALSADVTVTKGDLSLGNVENTALSTWTGNTSVKSVGTITAGTWNGTNIALNKLAKSAITIDGTSTALGGSVTTKNVLQTSNTEAKRRPLLLGVSSAATGTALATTTQTGQSFFNASIYAIPSTGKLYAAGYALTGGGTNLLTADGGSVAQSTFVATTRKVNGHALSADVTVTKGDLSLGNVENTALSTWTGNTSIKSVGTITAGTWNGTNIALNKLASSAITIDGTATALGGSITTKNVTQTNNTGTQYRPLLLGNNNHATAGSIPTATTTAGTVFNIGIYAQPSTKKLFAAGFQLTAGTANVLLGNGSSEARSNFATSSITHAEITAATANVAQKINVTADATTKHYLLGMAATGEMNSASTHLSSTGVYWENSNLYATSDERLKDFTGDVEVDFDKLKSIPKKYFKWKSEGPQGKTDIGTSAQKVLTLYPELVSGSEDSYYGVAYDKLSILALAAIDKLHEENEELRNEIKELKERLINLEK